MMKSETNTTDLCTPTTLKLEWPNETSLSFINEINQLPVLWDYDHPQYKDHVKKREAWHNLAVKFESPEEELKRKWLSLQASYRRERSKEFKQMDKKSPWFAYAAMSFLGDRYKPRREKFTIQIIKDGAKNDDTNDNDDDDDYNIEMEQFTDDGVNTETEDVFAGIATNVINEDSESIEKQEHDPECITTSTTVKQFLPSRARVKRERVVYDDPNNSNTNSNDNVYYVVKQTDDNITTTTKDKIQHQQQQQREECAVFGEYVMTKLRKLDSHSRAVAQHYINQTLFEAELGRYKQSFLNEHE